MSVPIEEELGSNFISVRYNIDGSIVMNQFFIRFLENKAYECFIKTSINDAVLKVEDY